MNHFSNPLSAPQGELVHSVGRLTEVNFGPVPEAEVEDFLF